MRLKMASYVPLTCAKRSALTRSTRISGASGAVSSRCITSPRNSANLFAERLMTVAHTARKQGRDVLAFLTGCCEAHAANTRPPSLFTASA